MVKETLRDLIELHKTEGAENAGIIAGAGEHRQFSHTHGRLALYDRLIISRRQQRGTDTGLRGEISRINQQAKAKKQRGRYKLNSYLPDTANRMITDGLVMYFSLGLAYQRQPTTHQATSLDPYII